MAQNHVAIVRSSARLANQRALETSQEFSSSFQDKSLTIVDEPNSCPSNRSSDPQSSSIEDKLAHMSVISISTNNSDGDELSQPRPKETKEFESNQVAKPIMPTLMRIESIKDIDECVDRDLSQENVLDKLEQNWRIISGQFKTVVEHLKQSSEEVSQASEDCLGSLVESIDLTCDKVDNEMKAHYHLISKCEELTTKLSIASDFRDEIKALRKSVETLEGLYKSKPSNALGVQRLRTTIK